jgi:hypothetical protein
VILPLPEVLCIVMFNLGVFCRVFTLRHDRKFRVCGTWFVGVGGDGFGGCWCGMMVCRCIGGGGGRGMVISGVWYVVCWHWW